MTDVNSWNTVAANNNAAPPDGWPEGMAYSSVNNSARENMAAIKRWFADMSGSLVGAGSVNAYTVTLNAGYAAYFTGMTFACSINITNTGAATLNVNAIGAKNIVNDQSGAALVAGALVGGQIYSFLYDGSNLRLLGQFDGTTSLARLTSTTAVALASTGHAFQIGASGAANLAMDTADIQARTNGAVSQLNLNVLGGNVVLGKLGNSNVINTVQQLVVTDPGASSAAVPGAMLGVGLTSVIQGPYAYTAIDNFSASAQSPSLGFRKSRNATVGSHTIVQNGDTLGNLFFFGSNGTSYDQGAAITAVVDGVPGASNDMPTRLDFYTTPDGTASWRRALSIRGDGTLEVEVGGVSLVSAAAIVAFQNTNLSGFSMDTTTRVLLNDYTNSKPRQVWENNGASRIYYNGVETFRTADRTANGSSSGGAVLDGQGNFRPVGFNTLPLVAKGTYTFALADVGYLVWNSAGAQTWTTWASSDTTMSAGMFWSLANAGSGNVTLAQGSGVTINWFDGSGTLRTGNRTLAVSGAATLIYASATSAFLWGTGIS